MRGYRIPESYYGEIDEYEKTVASFVRGDIPAVKMKTVRIPFGCYEERTGGKYMLRVRLAAGTITPAQLAGVANIAARYSQMPLHFTTRQDVQIHSLGLADTSAIIRELAGLGLSVRGSGGNTVRNVVASWDAGLSAEHPFDVSRYAEALTTRLIAERDSWELPRKFKAAFSGDETDSAYAAVNDLGFIAKRSDDGTAGFSVFLGGGAGAHPTVGIRIRDFIPARDVASYAQAAKRLFDRYGNRKNKHRARLRFVRETLGDHAFVRRFEDELVRVRESGYPELEIDAGERSPSGGYVIVPLFLGDCGIEEASTIAREAASFGTRAVRALPSQNLVIMNVPENETDALRARLRGSGVIRDMPSVFTNAVACAGASTCKLGICLSRNLLTAMYEASADSAHANPKLPDDLSIRISGCPNSCGQHALADIGFAGTAKRNGERQYPAYTLYAGADINGLNPALGKKLGVVPARRIPDFMSALSGLIAETLKDGERWASFVTRKEADIRGLALRFGPEQEGGTDDDFYMDWGTDEPFSLAKRSEGECSAGLLDLVEYDLARAREAIISAENAETETGAEALLSESVVASAHALLIAKGLEAKGREEVIELFRANFIGRHIGNEYDDLLSRVTGGGHVSAADAESILGAVKGLYERMDTTLAFPELEHRSEASPVSAVRKDLRGVACPLNFVKTKLALDSMETGEILEILLDDGEPIDNVPGSVEAEGHTVVRREKAGGHWVVVIKKGEAS